MKYDDHMEDLINNGVFIIYILATDSNLRFFLEELREKHSKIIIYFFK